MELKNPEFEGIIALLNLDKIAFLFITDQTLFDFKIKADSNN